jgi:hypothetical protein
MKLSFDPGKVATYLNKHSIPSFTSLQPSNVHTGLRRCTSQFALFSRVQHMRGLDVRTGASSRSIVEQLIESILSFTSESQARWPWRSRDSSRNGCNACKRLPQSRAIDRLLSPRQEWPFG